MKLIMESLNTLDRIPTALAALNNQVGLQLIEIINEIMEEVRERYCLVKRK
jgi:hypothetical protein